MVVMSVINITIGSKWRVALRRAKLAGQLLARMLMQGLLGERPVTLVGFSMGARLIFHCGLELARHGAAGLLEHVVLLGTPVSLRPERWAALRSVVARRVINGYSNNDWTLGTRCRLAGVLCRCAELDAAHPLMQCTLPAVPVPVGGNQCNGLCAAWRVVGVLWRGRAGAGDVIVIQWCICVCVGVEVW